MALSQPKERRISARRKVVTDLPGKLTMATSGDEVHCQPIDLSPFGIGIFAEEEIEDESQFILHVGQLEIQLEMVWSEESPGEKVGYRYGLRVMTPGIDLEKLFEDYL